MATGMQPALANLNEAGLGLFGPGFPGSKFSPAPNFVKFKIQFIVSMNYDRRGSFIILRAVVVVQL